MRQSDSSLLQKIEKTRNDLHKMLKTMNHPAQASSNTNNKENNPGRSNEQTERRAGYKTPIFEKNHLREQSTTAPKPIQQQSSSGKANNSSGFFSIAKKDLKGNPSQGIFSLMNSAACKKKVLRPEPPQEVFTMKTLRGSKISMPLYKESSAPLSLPYKYQTMLIDSNNDDDYETGEDQAFRAMRYCNKETEEGIDERVSKLRKQREEQALKSVVQSEEASCIKDLRIHLLDSQSEKSSQDLSAEENKMNDSSTDSKESD